MLLLDASVWIAAIDEDDTHHAAARRIVDGAGKLMALDLTLYEVANVVARRWQADAAAGAAVRAVAAACGDRLELIDPDLIEAAVKIARGYGITVYDAAYVAAARARGVPLVSCDMRDLVNRGLAVEPSAV